MQLTSAEHSHQQTTKGLLYIILIIIYLSWLLHFKNMVYFHVPKATYGYEVYTHLFNLYALEQSINAGPTSISVLEKALGAGDIP